MSFPPHMDADQIVDAIKVQFRVLADRGRRPEFIEMSEQYAEQLDSKFLRGHIVTIAIDESGAPAFGGVPIKRVAAPGILNVIMA